MYSVLQMHLVEYVRISMRREKGEDRINGSCFVNLYREAPSSRRGSTARGPPPGLGNNTTPTPFTLLLLLIALEALSSIPIFIVCCSNTAMTLISDQNGCSRGGLEYRIDPLVK